MNLEQKSVTKKYVTNQIFQKLCYLIYILASGGVGAVADMGLGGAMKMGGAMTKGFGGMMGKGFGSFF